MKILVTGAKGFVGKNLCQTLNAIKDGKAKTFDINPDLEIYEYDIDTNPDLLDGYCKDADFIFHLAGVNRPLEEKEFMEGNFGFTSVLLDKLIKFNNKAPIMISSSIQAKLDNPYGKSKKAGEDLIFKYGKDYGVKVHVYRFPNLFGKWCRPNYNSVVATFCYNVANGLPIKVNDRNVEITFNYIDDVVESLIGLLKGEVNVNEDGFCFVKTSFTKKLGEIADLINSFKDSRESKLVPDMSDGFTTRLYSTYLSYLPEKEFSYPLKMNIDDRGSFTEILRTVDRGQFSVNISKPGITKGNHWHHSKNEKFLVVSGRGVIRFRKIGDDKVIEYFVDGNNLQVVDIPTGYTHNIENIGDTDLVTFMWANECFNPEKPDTYFEKV